MADALARRSDAIDSLSGSEPGGREPGVRGPRCSPAAAYFPQVSFSPVILLNTGASARWSCRSVTK